MHTEDVIPELTVTVRSVWKKFPLKLKGKVYASCVYSRFN